MSKYGRSRNRGNNDGKYLRLTGLWQSKHKDNLFTGKLRAQDVEKLQEKIEEADGNDIGFFLWENETKGRKDPIFTLQCAVSESDGGGRGYKSRRDEEDERPRRGRYRDEEEETEEEEEEEEQEQDEEDTKPRGKGKSKASSKASKNSGKSTTKKSGKKDEDW